MRTLFAASLLAALGLAEMASSQAETVATLKVYILPEEKACGRAYGEPPGCTEWDGDDIRALERTSALLEEPFPNHGKIVLSTEQLRFRLKEYNDNVIKAECDSEDNFKSDPKVSLSERLAAVFLFTYNDDEPKMLQIKRTVRCGDNTVEERGHSYDKPSRLYHERAEYLFWRHDVSWEISIDLNGECFRAKTQNPLAPRAFSETDSVCDPSSVGQ